MRMAQVNATRTARHLEWTKAGPVESGLRPEEIETLEERSMATMAEPATLGLWGFATGTWITGTVIAGIFPTTALAAAAPVLIVFAGIGQFIAGLYAYRRTNALAGTAFTCFGSFNVTSGFVFLLQAIGLLPMTGPALNLEGFLLLSFGFIAIGLTLAALRTNMALVGVLGSLAVGYILSGIAAVTGAFGHPGAMGEVGHVGGYALIFSAGVAYYTGLALVLNSTWTRLVLPIWGNA
jgi:succinate-acetate transporter protein